MDTNVDADGTLELWRVPCEWHALMCKQSRNADSDVVAPMRTWHHATGSESDASQFTLHELRQALKAVVAGGQEVG